MNNKAVVSSILAAFAVGVVTTLINLYKDSGILNARVNSVEKSIGSIEKKVDDIHWFLIKKNNVKIKRQ